MKKKIDYLVKLIEQQQVLFNKTYDSFQKLKNKDVEIENCVDSIEGEVCREKKTYGVFKKILDEYLDLNTDLEFDYENFGMRVAEILKKE